MIEHIADMHIVDMVDLHVDDLPSRPQDVAEVARPEIQGVGLERFLIRYEGLDHLIKLYIVIVPLEAVIVLPCRVIYGVVDRILGKNQLVNLICEIVLVFLDHIFKVEQGVIVIGDLVSVGLHDP